MLTSSLTGVLVLSAVWRWHVFVYKDMSCFLSLLVLLMLDEVIYSGEDNMWPTLPQIIPTTSCVCLVQLLKQL